MNLLAPDPGLVFWSGLTFVLLLVILRKYAWHPILHAIKVREETIEYALDAAEKAKKDVRNLEVTKKQMIEDAKTERDKLIKEARELKVNIIEDAKGNAQKEADKIVHAARQQIEKEKQDAILELRQRVAALSVDIAGKLLEQELKTTDKQKALIDKYLEEVSFN
jgi:F-type H+-transporting ATPase subunit b